MTPSARKAMAILAIAGMALTCLGVAMERCGVELTKAQAEFWQTLLSGGFNLLALSTGYCGLRLSWARVMAIALTCMAVGCVVMLMDSMNSGYSISGAEWKQLLLFPISGHKWTPVHAFVVMTAFAPIFNMGTLSIGRHRFRLVLWILTAAIIYHGWLGNSLLLRNGMTLLLFIYFYLIGRYTALYKPSIEKPYILGMVAVGCLSLAAAVWTRRWFTGNETKYFGENVCFAPFVILFCVGIFLLATSVRVPDRFKHLKFFPIVIWALGAYIFIQNYTFPAIGFDEWSHLAPPALTVVTFIFSLIDAAIVCGVVYWPVKFVVCRAARIIPPFVFRSTSSPLPAIATSRRSAERNSALELVRILAMSMILVFHFLREYLEKTSNDSELRLWSGLVMGCVNIYVILAGFFTVRSNWRQFIRLVLLVMFFNAISAVGMLLSGYEIHLRDAVELLIYPLARGPYWFIRNYIFLMFLAPIINAGIGKLNLKSLRILVGILTFLMVWSGWLGHNEIVFRWDSQITLFLYLYTVGYWMAREPLVLKVHPQLWAFVYLTFALISGITDTGVSINYKGEIDYYNYCSAPLLVSAFAFVAIFIKFNFRNRLINLLGSSALLCYLIQESAFNWGPGYNMQQHFVAQLPFWPSGLLFYLAMFTGIWIMAVILNKVLMAMIGPLTDFIYRILPKRLKQDVN